MSIIRKIICIALLPTGFVLIRCESTPIVDDVDIETIENPQSILFDLDAIRARGTLKVIIDNSSTGYFVYKGQPMGYEYDLLDLFAKHTGVGLEFLLTTDLGSTFDLLNQGVGDIIAYSLTVTNERKEFVSFTHPHIQARQMLIQRKPDNWRQLKRHELEQSLIRNQVELIGKEIIVRPASAYASRLRNLSDELGGDINIVEDFATASTEDFIEMVSNGTITYTIADEHVALVNSTYFPNIDVMTPVSFPQQIAWAVRKNAPSLLSEVNGWIDEMQNKAEYYVIFNKYFKNSKVHLARAKSDFSNVFSGSRLSPYDDLIKETAKNLNWDWKLLAAQVFQESKFNPTAKSWAGAIGLMQLVPRTGMAYGITNLENPESSLTAGSRHIKWLNDYWRKKIPDSLERVKFILGSYNVGQGHVLDAYKLTKKYDRDETHWDTVAEYLLKKSNENYFKDPVVKYGYCRCTEPVEYVESIFSLYEHYSTLLSKENHIESSD